MKRNNPFDSEHSYKRASTDDNIQDSLENDYSSHMSTLADTVSQMKEVALHINGHLKDEKKTYDSMDGQFYKVNNLMALTTKKIDEVLSSGSGKISCYLVGVVILFLFILWLL